MIRRLRLLVAFGLAMSLWTGCGSGTARLANDLKTTGLVYHLYHDDHKQGPSGWDELIKYAQDTNNSPDSIRRVKDAGYEMKWGVKFDNVKEDLANTTLGKPPGQGPALMMDGGVR